MRKIKLHQILFFLVSFVLVFIWFRNGNTLGAGEMGNPFYNLKQMFGISGYAWGNQVVGGNSGLTTTSGTFWGFMYLLNKVGLSGAFLQAGLFFFCLFFSMQGMYLLIKETLPQVNNKGLILGSVFYVFNPFSLANIWNRFLLNTILFYSIFPILLWLFISGINNKKYSNAILISIITAVLSYAYAGPAQTILYWGILFFTAVFIFLTSKKNNFAIKFFILHLLSWIVFNIWWLSQQILFRLSNTYAVATAQFYSGSGNYKTLISLSDVLGKLRNIFLLQHGTFFTDSTDLPFKWPLLYSTKLALILQWIVITYILFIALKNIKNRKVFYFIMLFSIGIYLAKGISNPLGEFFNLAFQKISILTFFRNPFEKLGVILPLALSPLFALAFSKINKFFGFVYVFVFLGFPFWTVLVFSSGNPPANMVGINYEVEVPNYYKEANEYLKKQPGQFRFITFPIGDEGIFYTWNKGYAGVEQSGLLFDVPNISYNTGIPYYHDTIKGLEEVLLKDNDFYKIASLFNVKYFIVRDDIDYKRSGLRDPEIIKKRFQELNQDKNSHIHYVKSFGKLDLYKLDDSVFIPKIYAAIDLVKEESLANVKDVSYIKFMPGEAFVLDNKIFSHLNPSSVLVYPNNVYLENILRSQISSDSNIFPYITNLPNDIRYWPMIVKEKSLTTLMLDPEKRAELLISILGKRIKEIEKAVKANQTSSLPQIISLYKDTLQESVNLFKTLPRNELTKEKVWHQSYLSIVFRSHIGLINSLEVRDDSSKKLLSNLINQILQVADEFNLFTKYKIIKTNEFGIDRRTTFQFNVEESGNYEFVFNEKDWSKYYETPMAVTVQVDNELQSRKLQKTSEGYVGLGTFKLETGIHEISLDLPKAKNLLDINPIVDLSTDNKKVATKEFNIRDFDPFSSYHIQFNYITNYGEGFTVYLKQNIDYVLKGEIRSPFNKLIKLDKYWRDKRAFSYDFSPGVNADSGQIAFSIKPWNNCREIVKYAEYRCKNKEFYSLYDRDSKTTITDLKLEKNLRGAFLRRVIGDSSLDKLSTPKVDFEKISQSYYKVHIRNATEPYLLVFSELFDNGWNIYFEKQKVGTKILVNGYADGWYITKTGDYDLDLKFSPQDSLDKTIKYSTIYVPVVLLIFGLIKYKKR